MIKDYLNGQHETDIELQESYLDWFFLSKFGKGPGFWKQLPEDKIESLMAFENENEKRHWETWIKIYSKIYGK